ncbi:cadherin-like and PC-esterase domain-containing protein 1 [Rhipicephalus microplus]|uniref:cadherin-like and PC-esterase domain-containing protein 1 n=1 Tax=Rhipicephalus microplus TaxID=6941 RepID=UPI003F6D0BCA
MRRGFFKTGAQQHPCSAVQHTRWCWRCLSVRDLLLLLCSFAMLSVYMSYRLTSLHLQNNPQDAASGLGDSLQRNSADHAVNQRSARDVQPARSTTLNNRLRKMLVELEEEHLRPLRESSRVVVVRGHKAAISRDLPLIGTVLAERGWQLRAPTWFRRAPSNTGGGGSAPANSVSGLGSAAAAASPLARLNNTAGNDGGNMLQQSSEWVLLLCLSFSDGDNGACVETAELSQYQAVNKIPGLKNVLLKKDAFCNTMNDARKIPGVMKASLVPLCFVLPTQYQQFVNVADALGYSAHWMLTPLAPGAKESAPEALDIFTPLGRARIQQASTRRAVVQQALSAPLLVHGQPVSLRVFVLITSLSPLRAYVHTEGMVRLRSYRTGPASAKPGMRVQPLSRFWRFVERNYGRQSLQTALESLSDVLVRTLLVAEAVLQSTPAAQGLRRSRLPKCFQLLGVDLTLNTSFQPVVTEVNGQPSFYRSPRVEDEPTNRLKQRVLADALSLLFGARTVADELAEAVDEVFENLGIMGFSCQISHDLCLSREDLVFLMDTRRESVQTGGFQQLYPTYKSGQYKTFIDELEQLHMGTLEGGGGATEDMQRSGSQHGTADMHPIVVALQRHFNRHVADDNYSDLEPEPSDVWKGTNSSSVQHSEKQEDDFLGGSQDFYASSQPTSANVTCSRDPSTMPYLARIVTEPSVRLQPAFKPQRTEYFANVSYDLVLVKVWGLAQHCGSQVRVDDKYGPARPANYTLGVGENKVVLYVMDGGQPDPWVVNAYTLLIRRMPLADDGVVFSPATQHQVCSLKQECEMQVAPGEPCGLYSETSVDWPSYLEKTARLPVCKDGSSQGRWMVPCEKCAAKESCYWKEARWQPYQCRYVNLPQRTLARCMAGKKLLFIGDSTNRGMMHYVMERLNGSLQHWDKTHDLRVYANLNRGETAVAFAYYPQFWLPTSQRPVFDKALYQLIERSKPLQNNSNTVLIVGGVHWLATQHLYMLVKALRGDHLQGIKLIIKTLGAGFHQPVEGIHCLSMNEQKKLMMQNLWLAEFARHYYIDVIDTFNITVARYKDFLQGKCACHFHKVVPVQAPKNRPPGKPPPPPSYHVEGDINAVYSEILLNRICAKYAEDS